MATASELKAIIDAWIAPRINQDAGFASGSAPTADRLNELFNLLIDQGDSATSVLATVRDYLAAYTEGVDATITNSLEEAYTSWLADRAVELQQTIDSANAAVITANAASSTATTAAANANAAQTTAAQAATDANAAKNVAVSAAATANAAATTANAAASAANNAASSLVAETATGTGTAIVLTNISLIDGFIKTFVAGASNAGAATTVNGKPLYMPPNTTTAPNIVAGKIYTIVYNLAGTRFFLEASAEGDATAAHVLAPHRFSNGIDVNILGTMVPIATTANSPGYINDAATLGRRLAGAYSVGTAQVGGLFLRPEAGYYDGANAWSYIVDPDFIAPNLPADKNMFGLQGTIPVRGGETYPGWRQAAEIAGQPSQEQRVHLSIPLGLYRTGIDANNLGLYADDPDFISPNILSTASPFGLQGSIPVRHLESVVATSVGGDAGGNLYMQVPKAYYDGGANVYANDPDYNALNIPSTLNMFGLQGTMLTKTFTNGNGGAGNYHMAISTEGFPGTIFMRPVLPDGSFVCYQGDVHIRANDASFIAANILNTAAPFGLQGTAQAGIKFASGTVSGTTVVEGYTGTKGGTNQTLQRYSAVVTGLTFKPDFIMLIRNGLSDHQTNIYYCKNTVTPGFNTVSVENGSGTGEFYHDPDYTPSVAYVTATGFKLPCYVSGGTYTWIALQCSSQSVSWT